MMSWEQDQYGLEYDLSQFNVVVLDDFTTGICHLLQCCSCAAGSEMICISGAMENKGLNMYNSACVTINEETAT